MHLKQDISKMYLPMRQEARRSQCQCLTDWRSWLQLPSHIGGRHTDWCSWLQLDSHHGKRQANGRSWLQLVRHHCGWLADWRWGRTAACAPGRRARWTARGAAG